ncbi:hypothetical protein EG327_011449 [Venturia inaequalis]|uniref:Uncharacterized protein n=1 Tax=Venturia inaequalis TaxID=5025 RepID=A0A8H3ZI58_VENIN|nr:hypothetical protein EG327_011449 [Venturia inaequalis]
MASDYTKKQIHRGGSGIGLMATQALAVNGAKVYITGRTKEKLDMVTNTYNRGVAGQIISIASDITDKKDIVALYDEIANKEEHLDILINNAGISTETFETFETEANSAEAMKKQMFDDEKATFKDWDDLYRSNVS